MSFKSKIEFVHMGTKYLYLIDLPKLTMTDMYEREFPVRRNNDGTWIYEGRSTLWYPLNPDIAKPLEALYQEYLLVDSILLGEVK